MEKLTITEEDLLLSSTIPYGDNSPLYKCYDEEGQPLWKQTAYEYFNYDRYLQLLKDFNLKEEF